MILMCMMRSERNCGFSKWRLELSFLRLSLRWRDQVRHLSKVRPRYFTSIEWGIIMLLIYTAGQFWGLSEKVITENLDSLIFIFQLRNHWERVFRWVWIWWDAVVYQKKQIIRRYHQHIFQLKYFLIYAGLTCIWCIKMLQYHCLGVYQQLIFLLIIIFEFYMQCM